MQIRFNNLGKFAPGLWCDANDWPEEALAALGRFRLQLNDLPLRGVVTFQLSFHPFCVPKGEVGDIRFEVGAESALSGEG